MLIFNSGDWAYTTCAVVNEAVYSEWVVQKQHSLPTIILYMYIDDSIDYGFWSFAGWVPTHSISHNITAVTSLNNLKKYDDFGNKYLLRLKKNNTKNGLMKEMVFIRKENCRFAQF